MKKEVIKAIVFDIGGVLQIPHYYVHKNNKEFSSIHEMIARALHLHPDNWLDAIDLLYAKATIGEVSRNKFVQEVSKKLNISQNTLVHAVKKSYHKHMKKNKELYIIVQSLQKKGYIVGILSDQWPLSRESIFPKKDQKLFDFAIISYEVKTRKPQPKIYQLLLKKIREKDKSISTSEIIFVDDKNYNLVPAKKMGIHTIQFHNNKQVIKELKKLNVAI
ncbi:MAG: HAD-IA family hydrolase [Nanoarchaeota archaeon]